MLSPRGDADPGVLLRRQAPRTIPKAQCVRNYLCVTTRMVSGAGGTVQCWTTALFGVFIADGEYFAAARWDKSGMLGKRTTSSALLHVCHLGGDIFRTFSDPPQKLRCIFNLW